MATVSVIIVNYNGRHFLADLFESLAAQRRPADEVILVDNASSDESIAYTREHFPWVEIVALATNTGFAGGNNAGVERSTGDYLALINSDTTADPSWLAELVPALEADVQIGAVVPKIYRADAPGVVEQAGGEFNNLGHFWTRGFNQVDRGQLDELTEVPGLTGCSALIRRTALGGMPLFDPHLFMYYEEFELTLRLREQGYRIVYVPGAIVHHKGMQSVKRSTSQPRLFQQHLCNRNRLKIILKYYPAGLLARGLPLIVLSVMYWNWLFLRHRGLRFCLTAMAAQVRYAAWGLAERRRSGQGRAELWLPWMTRQSLRDVLALKAARGEAG